MNAFNKNLIVTIICLIYSSSILIYSSQNSDTRFTYDGLSYVVLLYHSNCAKVTYPGPQHYIGETSYPSINGSLRIPGYIYNYSKLYYIVGIEKYAFDNCNGLTSVDIGYDLAKNPFYDTVIEEYAFYCCNGLTSVTIRDNVTTIDKEAFYGCSSLTHLVIGKYLKSFHYFALFGCPNVRKIFIRSINPPDINVFGEPVSKSNTDYWNFTKMIENVTVYVPIGCADKYKDSSWGLVFKNIVEEMSGIDEVAIDELPKVEEERFTIDGRKISSPMPGINVIRYSDGSTHKTLVR